MVSRSLRCFDTEEPGLSGVDAPHQGEGSPIKSPAPEGIDRGKRCGGWEGGLISCQPPAVYSYQVRPRPGPGPDVY